MTEAMRITLIKLQPRQNINAFLECMALQKKKFAPYGTGASFSKAG